MNTPGLRHMSTPEERLREQIDARGVSGLARSLGVARNTLYNWCEKGNVPLNKLYALGEAGVDVAYVLTGHRLREERIRLGLSQSALADIGGVKKLAQINYEKSRRQPDAAYLRRIAEIGADVAYIITGQQLTDHAPKARYRFISGQWIEVKNRAAKEEIAARLREVRGALGIGEFAQKIGVNRKTVTRWENGFAVPEGDSLQTLQRPFSVDPAWLLFGLRSTGKVVA